MMKNILSKIPAFIISLVKIFFLEFILLFFFRLAFYLTYKTPDVSEVPGSTILSAFAMGFEFDMVATTYAVFLPAFLLILNEYFHKRSRIFNRLGFFFTFLIYCIYALVSCADFPYFKQFSAHLSKQAFLWNSSPDFVLKLIFGSFSYYRFIFLLILIIYCHYKILKRIFTRNAVLAEEKNSSVLRISISVVLLIPFLIAGARGRLSGKSTTHEGLAIVSENLFVNQLALNPNFTMFRSLLFQKVKNYEVPSDIKECIAFAKKYLGSTDTSAYSVSRMQTADSAFKPLNVVIVCMESMSSYKMGIQGHPVLTPFFNNIVKESLYFDRFFSSGIHTFNGLFSTCAGFPSALTDHALRRYTRQPFTTLGNLLLKKNYFTCFMSTHDPYFDNMQGFFRLNGYEHAYSSFDLPGDKKLSVTGVPDHEIFNLLIKTVNTSSPNQPFLAFIMTGSDHGPWTIPTDIPFKPDADTEEKRATQYADWALGYLMEEAKKQSWYKNTLFVFVADHGYYLPDTYEMPMSYNHVPFVMHHAGTLGPDTIHNLGYQPDIVSTVAGYLNLSFENNSFGVNLLKEKHDFVFFGADDKIGCVSDDGYLYYELITQKTKRLKTYPVLSKEDYYLSKKTKADSLERSANQMMKAAEYLIRKNYFSY